MLIALMITISTIIPMIMIITITIEGAIIIGIVVRILISHSRITILCVATAPAASGGLPPKLKVVCHWRCWTSSWLFLKAPRSWESLWLITGLWGPLFVECVVLCSFGCVGLLGLMCVCVFFSSGGFGGLELGRCFRIA